MPFPISQTRPLTPSTTVPKTMINGPRHLPENCPTPALFWHGLQGQGIHRKHQQGQDRTNECCRDTSCPSNHWVFHPLLLLLLYNFYFGNKSLILPLSNQRKAHSNVVFLGAIVSQLFCISIKILNVEI